MDRTTLLWTLTLFFGASVVFGLIRSATKDEGTAASIGFQALALVVIVGGILAYMRGRT